MDTFPSNVQFRKPWRSYQQRVLDELKDHLDDNHLHVIAAPGSGKTVLGLEVMRRLNRPALILSPTVAIRDQWIDRFVALFLDNGRAVPPWISRDIRKPQFITASTYQGLHSVYTGAPEDGGRKTEDGERRTEDRRQATEHRGRTAGGKEALRKRLQQLGVRTLVLDEAHHLRNEWWKCLADLNKHLGEPTVVALTATAPFDVSPFEWERYIGLCGPIDSEISVPELVAQKNLCPHQDYVYMSTPLQAEQQAIRQFRQEADAFVQRLCADHEFAAALEGHGCVSRPTECVEEILDDPPFYSSVAFFLNHVRGRPPRELIRVLGLSPRQCRRVGYAHQSRGNDGGHSPPYDWLEILLTGCFYTHTKSFEAHKDLFQRLLRDAKRAGVVDRRTVSLKSNTNIARLLIRSASKLRSIEDIVKLESDSLGPNLRMVVLTDHIRRADFPKDQADVKPIKRLGVVPIFEQIRRAEGSMAAGVCDAPSSAPAQDPDGWHAQTCLSVSSDAEGTNRGRHGQPSLSMPPGKQTASHMPAKLGILSGTLTVIPSEAGEALRTTAPKMDIDPADIDFRPLDHDGRFCEVTIRGADKHKMVALITSLFNQGSITVLIGTTSLLGEGWDAPSVNSLILASFVGSYMLSNQMRGRAIRTQDGNPTKTANIWHLVCQEEHAKGLNEDMETLSRRFKSFVGVSFTSNRIESGLGRLGLGAPPYPRTRIDHINAVMTRRACDRAKLTKDWERALGAAGDGHMVEQVAASQLALPKDFVFRNTILALLWQGWFWGLSVFSLLMQGTERNSDKMGLRGLLILLAVATGAAALAALPKCLKALWLFLWHGSIASSMKQVGKAVLKAMVQGEQIETSLSQLKVVARPLDYGFVSCSLQGGTTRERSIFLDALQEVLGPIENPRYVLVRKSLLGWFLRKDYHTVPTVLGKNKDVAEYFRKMWARHVGPTDLVYTRTPEGRRFLLKARTRSMSCISRENTDRLKSWQ
ncbi:MAG: DEAD/DEAH box helicase family protein [Planctomycetes bacterium]|nr:DEAD/DEAH box helicase family protein [Planctomycetota bacterium]